MSATKLLKDLPGFAKAMALALDEDASRRAKGYTGYPLELVGEISIPSLKRISSWTMLETLALHILIAQGHEKSRLRLVPPPQKRMSPHKLGGWYARVLGPMAMIAKSVANDREAANG